MPARKPPEGARATVGTACRYCWENWLVKHDHEKCRGRWYDERGRIVACLCKCGAKGGEP